MPSACAFAPTCPRPSAVRSRAPSIRRASPRCQRRLIEMGAFEVAVSDTIGIAHPGQVPVVLEAVAARVPLAQIALHFHDTRGTALANVLAALQHGVATFDASCGGLGGCPYAPGATGNLATEDLVYMLDGLGIETGRPARRAAGGVALHRAARRARAAVEGTTRPRGSRLPASRKPHRAEPSGLSRKPQDTRLSSGFASVTRFDCAFASTPAARRSSS